MAAAMSSRTYNQLWIKTQTELQNIIQDENAASSAKPEKVEWHCPFARTNSATKKVLLNC